MTDGDVPAAAKTTVSPDALPPQSSEYLETIAADAFKRGVELDESVWRSLPFFSATLALTAAVIGHASTSVPHLTLSAFAILASIVLAAAALALAWSLRWFWEVIRPRDYEYPAPAADIQLYASALAAYHDEPGLSREDVDMRIVQDLRSFLLEQYAEAADNNFRQNEIRLETRSSALLWMMAALVLAFACETLIFLHAAIAPVRGMEIVDDRKDNTTARQRQGAGSTAGAAARGAGQAGRGTVQAPCDRRHSPQAMSDKPITPAPSPAPAPSPIPAPAVRPQPPAPQILKKNQ